MDIFNKKRVEELEKDLKKVRERLKEVEQENTELRELLDKAGRNIDTILKVKQSTPDDCIPGPYCKACEFSKEYYFYHGSYLAKYDRVHRGWVCNKANVCKNFTQKEVSNETQ